MAKALGPNGSPGDGWRDDRFGCGRLRFDECAEGFGAAQFHGERKTRCEDRLTGKQVASFRL